jgi:hypothetical protein
MASQGSEPSWWAGIPRWAIYPLAIGVCAALWLAADGRLSGDEPSYLYAAKYLTFPEIFAGDVQPSGIPGFLQGRILHLLFLKGVFAIAGDAEPGFHVLQFIHLLITVLNLWLIERIAQALMPQLRTIGAATLLLAAAPVVLYFAFKTTADNEALLAALVATLALARIAEGRGAAWMAAAVLALAAAALTKNQMIFVPAAFWFATCLVPVGRLDRRRLALQGALCGLAGAALTIAFLEVTGIGVTAYIESYRAPFANQTPLIAKLMNLGTELGLLWLLLPFALLSRRRRELLVCILWFLGSMAPFLFLSGVEPRQVAVNLAAAGGLIALALEALGARFGNPRLTAGLKAAAAVLGVFLLLASDAVMLPIMPHKVDLPRLQQALAGLDKHYGPGGYQLVAADGYADFHIIRVLWPDRDVRNAGTAVILARTALATRKELLQSYLDGRYYDSVAGLRSANRPLVYFGFRKTFAAENLRVMLDRASPALAERALGRVELVEHLYAPETKWLWDSPEVRLVPLLQAGNYQAMEIRIQRPGG